MGEVYRARDTRLDRTVAIKVLSSALAAEPQLQERFEREARAISSLNHPHICALYDVGHQAPSTDASQAIDFLVLEYLEGQTLAERLARSAGSAHGVALPPPEALKIAIDICDALDTAHRSGIVHRDLKPANVMLTKSGAKLLDFGLARSAAPVVATSRLSMLPTTPPNLTAQGAILGTFQYMAPEQIEGLEADARTDIFAFGALLFEMLTGRPVFEDKTRASLLGAILKDQPPRISTLQPAAPKALDRIVNTCLAKDPDERYQSARDLLRDLKWVASSDAGEGAPAMTVAVQPRSNRIAWSIAGAALVAAVAAALWAVQERGRPAPAAAAAQFTIAPPENTSFGGPGGGGTGNATQLAISPDGRHIVFVAGGQNEYQIWLRSLASVTITPIPGTEGGAFPFWSPDSRFIGFFADGKLKKVPIGGGPPVVLCDTQQNGRGGSWSRDNIILFSPGTPGAGLMRVSSAGGTPAAATTIDPATGETNHRWPHFLPDGQHFIYTATTGTCCPAARPSVIRVGSLGDTGAGPTLLQLESSGSYSSGHLLFARDDTLMAQPFDLDTRRLHGDAFPLAQHIGSEGSRYVSASASENGTLVYAPAAVLAPHQLTWVDRAGNALSTVGEPAPFLNLALSPDERRVAVSLASGTPENRDIWLMDLARHDILSRLTFEPGNDWMPVWSADGSRIVYAGVRAGVASLRYRVINGAADESLLEGVGAVEPTDWSTDGRFIAFTNARQSVAPDVWVLPMFGDRKPYQIAHTQFPETAAVFSPDGRWIAFSEGGAPNVYVQPFPGDGGKYQVSRNGGSRPTWRADGRELFYLSADGTMMAVPIEATTHFDPGVAQALFKTDVVRASVGRQYAVTKDGKRFLITRRRQELEPPVLTVVFNWSASVQK